MALRNIREMGDDILNKKCKPVKEVNERTLDLIDDMFETIKEFKKGLQDAAIKAPFASIFDCQIRVYGEINAKNFFVKKFSALSKNFKLWVI